MTEPADDIFAQLKQQATEQLKKITTPEELEQWRVNFLGRKGQVPRLLRTVKDQPAEQRAAFGQHGNKLRQELEGLLTAHQKKVGTRAMSQPQPKVNQAGLGHLHPLTLTRRRLQNIMAALGFLIIEGPEVEEEKYDFDALNIPFEHPARAETDTFYLAPRSPRGDGRVLRTSTSAVQVRAVIENDLVPPFQIASPGRVFRNEKPDPTHESTFYQLEALMVGPSVTVADYRSITEALFSTFFGKVASIRLRPGYFPFVEPGFEIDMSCPFCQSGCRLCKQTTWIEMGGAGMVHPNVLSNMNVDPEKYQGFAFGYGIDRFTMLQHGIDDIRLFWSGDIRFLKQFA
ncbi:phenylalanine--tRNA ligase subunit alpha [Patescibacteria group bacterium]|nr:phenylalanine--tRNA ligase subunit alpha [Patescibacteria group bacterium]